MEFIKNLLRNPLTIWLSSLRIKCKLLSEYPTLKIGYLTFIKDCKFGDYVTIFDFVNLSHTNVGAYSYINSNSHFRKVTIGRFCSIGTNVTAGLGIHPTHYVSTHPAFYSFKPSIYTFATTTTFDEEKFINIGNDVWIGSNVLIMDGIKIGNGAIIAAGAVVANDVPDYAIVGGVPAKIIRYRFDKSVCNKLTTSCWWNQSNKWLKTNWALMQDVNGLIKYFEEIKPLSND